MTDEQMIIAIAEALGYTHVRIIKDIEGPPDIGIGHHPTKPHSVPDYLNDLNAMHEAEGILTNEQIEVYCSLLQKPQWGIWWAISATARQRAEAFIKTLNLEPK